MRGHFTEEELNIAKRVDLVKVAEQLGYTPVRIGRYYTLKEMDSIRIYDRSHWYRWSSDKGGSQIDFLKVFANLEIKEAVFWLLDFAGYHREGCSDPTKEKKTELSGLKNQVTATIGKKVKEEFILPEKNENNQRLYHYLESRGLSRETIDHFVSLGLLYETKKYHNICFLGNDSSGVTRFASLRGIFDVEGKKSFKMDVAGNDKSYGFNRVKAGSDRIVVTEAAIDLMSYVELTRDTRSNLLALGMVADRPLETFLKEHSGIQRITFALDNDEAGRKATKKLEEKYQSLGYEVRRLYIPEEYKDLNEWVSQKRMESMELSRHAI